MSRVHAIDPSKDSQACDRVEVALGSSLPPYSNKQIDALEKRVQYLIWCLVVFIPLTVIALSFSAYLLSHQRTSEASPLVSSLASEGGVTTASFGDASTPFVYTRPRAAILEPSTMTIIKGQDAGGGSADAQTGGTLWLQAGVGDGGSIGLQVWKPTSTSTNNRRLLASSSSSSSSAASSSGQSDDTVSSSTRYDGVEMEPVSVLTVASDSKGSQLAAASATISVIASQDGNGNGNGKALAYGICNNKHVAEYCEPQNSTSTNSTTSDVAATTSDPVLQSNLSSIIVSSDNVVALHSANHTQVSSETEVSVSCGGGIEIQAAVNEDHTSSNDDQAELGNAHANVESVHLHNGNIFVGSSDCARRNYLIHQGATHAQEAKCSGAHANDSDFIIQSENNDVIVQGVEFHANSDISSVHQIEAERVVATFTVVTVVNMSTTLVAFDLATTVYLSSNESATLLPHSSVSLTVSMDQSYIWLPRNSKIGSSITILVASITGWSFYLVAPVNATVNGAAWILIPSSVTFLTCTTVRVDTFQCLLHPDSASGNAVLEAEIATLQSQVATQASEISQLQSSVAQLTASNAQLVSLLSQVTIDLASLKSNVSVSSTSTSHALQSLQQADAAFDSRIDMLNQTALAMQSTLQSNVSTLTELLEGLRNTTGAQVNSLQLQSTALAGRLSGLQSNLSSDISALQSNISSEATLIHQLQATVTASGTVSYFNLTACPLGWIELTQARGRYLTGLPSGGSLGLTVGTALSNGETRMVPSHSHNISDPGHTHPSVRALWEVQCDSSRNVCSQNTAPDFTGTGPLWLNNDLIFATTGVSVVSTGDYDPSMLAAPYLQLLICQKI